MNIEYEYFERLSSVQLDECFTLMNLIGGFGFSIQLSSVVDLLHCFMFSDHQVEGSYKLVKVLCHSAILSD